ncbi:ATP-binding cassette domain-containing protein [Enterococcus mundtii]|nr:ABC transporter ATP-binding protein [Enterococcus mundtii]MZU11425.1 ATP-binding cassette domain-containing protein [Bifidobacterium longum]AUB54416.1 hypothetical protein EM4838_15470 [Enterococcus mundtii]MZZ60065.1 ATP-binding cassette domain-containing protein [Enterococcus mundtii]MZZ63069.1 ATP-binding cassette domain-containing protein [Enterococcus mundtii]MZZ70077.1 ATP-binding cassette domain-containing protein [Enterococcus mundtii]
MKIIQVKKILLKRKLLLLTLASLMVIQICISASYPYLTKVIVDEVLMKKQVDKLKVIIMVAVILIVVQVPLNIIVSYLCSKWNQLIIFELRKNVSMSFFDSKENSKKNGLFINTITNDCELIGKQLLNIIINSFPNILLIVIYLSILIFLNPFLVGILLLGLPLFLLIAYFTSKKVSVLTKELQRYRDRLVEFLNSYVRNKLLIDLYGARREETNYFYKVSTQLKDVNVKTNTIISFLNNISNLIAVITPLITLLVGSFLVINNKLSLGSLITFNTYTALLFSPIGRLLNISPMISQLKVSIERIKEVKIPAEIYKEGIYDRFLCSDDCLISVSKLIPYVEKRPLLKTELNFNIKKGELLKISGKNGIGKSILLQCLINYHKNFTGYIQIDKNVKIIYIPQENFLFEGTVKENLTKGLPEYEIDFLFYLIRKFKFEIDLNRKVNAFSLNLSSGQLQKIKLIRALLSKPDILLLDEVFANLDHETSITLINYLRENLLTAIFVYHGDTERLLKQNEYNTLNLDYYAIA